MKHVHTISIDMYFIKYQKLILKKNILNKIMDTSTQQINNHFTFEDEIFMNDCFYHEIESLDDKELEERYKEYCDLLSEMNY